MISWKLGVVAFDDKRAPAASECQHVVDGERLENRFQVVKTVGTDPDNPEVKVDFRERWKNQ